MAQILTIRPRAARDVDDHAEYLAREASAKVSARFLEMLEKTFGDILDFPELGSPWETDDQRIRGTRFRIMRRFKNHLVFYRIEGETIEIVRVLHASRNIERFLAETDG